MKPEPKHNISAQLATDIILEGKSLKDFYIEGKINIETLEGFDKEIIIENCIVEYFSGSLTSFHEKIKFENCQFIDCNFVSSYFQKGLLISNCTFENYLDFQTGGHNQHGAIEIMNNNFKGFVNFFDCIYEDDIFIINNTFQQGTNLSGKPFNIPVSFYKGHVIKGNTGNLDYDHEGNI